jgi:hypothetical protein
MDKVQKNSFARNNEVVVQIQSYFKLSSNFKICYTKLTMHSNEIRVTCKT